jgi:hypothetical protein
MQRPAVAPSQRAVTTTSSITRLGARRTGDVGRKAVLSTPLASDPLPELSELQEGHWLIQCPAPVNDLEHHAPASRPILFGPGTSPRRASSLRPRRSAAHVGLAALLGPFWGLAWTRPRFSAKCSPISCRPVRCICAPPSVSKSASAYRTIPYTPSTAA